MVAETWREARNEALTARVMTGAADVLASGVPLTFREVAAASGVPERTIYRHFPSRQDLLTALFEWTNRRLGHEPVRPTDLQGATALVRAAFPGFDDHAAVVGELLTSPEGRAVRLADKSERQASAIRLVDSEVPRLDVATARRLASIVQLLMTASAWQGLRDYWDMDGAEAAEAAATALELLLRGARAVAESSSRGEPS